MKIQINNITPQYEGSELQGFRIHFTGDLGNVRLSGYMPFKADEVGDFIKMDLAEDAIADKVVENIMNGNDPIEGEDAE